MKIALADLKAVIFKEKHTSDSISQDSAFPFDIDITEKDGIDFNLYYCARLLERVLNFEKEWTKAFLEYQCRLKTHPISWLNALEQLIRLNGELLIQFGFFKEMSNVFALMDEQRNALRRHQFERPQVQIVDTTEEPILDNPKPSASISKANEISKLPWNGPTNILADLFFQAMQTTGDDGKALLPTNSSEIIDFIEQHFYRLDGKPFSRGTLKTYLSPSRTEKRPTEGKGIVLKKPPKNKGEE